LEIRGREQDRAVCGAQPVDRLVGKGEARRLLAEAGALGQIRVRIERNVERARTRLRAADSSTSVHGSGIAPGTQSARTRHDVAGH
jgi:hypothetical protein